MMVEECSTVWLTEMSLSILSSMFKNEGWFPLPIRLPQMKHLECCLEEDLFMVVMGLFVALVGP